LFLFLVNKKRMVPEAGLWLVATRWNGTRPARYF